MGPVDLARKVLAEGTYQDGMDKQTANVLVLVADALNAENAAKLNALSPARAAEIAWKAVK